MNLELEGRRALVTALATEALKVDGRVVRAIV
jgi:hypothetical protein